MALAPSPVTLRALRTDLKRQRVIIDQHQVTLDAQFRHIAALQTHLDVLTTNLPAAPARPADTPSGRRSYAPALLSPPGQLRRIPAAHVPDGPTAMAADLDDGQKRRGLKRRGAPR
jgi:hypothetical protein